MKRIAPAKINLNLAITGRRNDGYHLLDSTMIFTLWGDEITLKSSDQFRLTADGPYSNIFTGNLLATDEGSPNLIVRAVYLMAKKAGKNPDIHIHVTKNIPAGAGLGGGSSDAATVMHMLNEYWDMGLSIDEMSSMGLTLGAELPVCLFAKSARVTGIGDSIKPVTIKNMHLLIVWPDNALLTKDVFEAYRGMELPFNEATEDWQDGNNDLTGAAIELCPEIGEILSKLSESDQCTIARMSGSGSACFGVFESKQAADKAARQFDNAIVTEIYHS